MNFSKDLFNQIKTFVPMPLLAILLCLLNGHVLAGEMQLSDLNRFSNSPLQSIRVILKFTGASTQVGVDAPAGGAGQDVVKQNLKRDRLLQRMGKSSVNLGRFNDPNLLSMQVNRAELQSLISDPEIQVYENRWHQPSLQQSTPIVFPNQASASFSGSGWSVAVLDTGVEKSHSFLSGRVIDAAEACFSNDGVAGEDPMGLGSLCPGQAGQSIGAGSAAPCTLAQCDHGTKMAGIIAGSNTTLSGVATSASLIPVQVYSKSNSEVDCGIGNAPCIGALTTDIIRGLEYIFSIRNSRQIAAVNVSLSSVTTFQGACDAEPSKAAIDDLRSARIAVIAPTGNQSQNNETSSPACISTAVAVAATDNTDSPWPFNNRSSIVDLFAPGVAVESSGTPASTFVTDTGTSISTAFVSGAWAVLREKNSTRSVNQVLSVLKSGGPLVTQSPSITRRRLDVDGALAATPVSVVSDELCVPVKTQNSSVALICL